MLNRFFRYKRIRFLLLIPLGLFLILAARWDRSWVEQIHAKTVYPLFANSLGGFLSLMPFSVLEILVFLFAAAAVFYLIWSVVKITRHPAQWKNRLWRLGLNLACVLSAGWFAFVLFMGLNYYRAPITDYLNLTVKQSETKELYDLCVLLAEDCNHYRAQMKENEEGVSLLNDGGFYETADSARDAYRALSEKIPVLKAANVRNKPLLTSKLFSLVLTTGIYIPFESGINVDVPPHTVPATMCHELTHFRGFMREDEANFLGYLACMESHRADFKYSGSLMAFGYAFNALYDDDQDLAAEAAAVCGEGMRRDLRAESDYWKPYRHTKISKASNQIYDQYLQANDQPSGMKSYGEMVDLLLAYYRNFNET